MQLLKSQSKKWIEMETGNNNRYIPVNQWYDKLGNLFSAALRIQMVWWPSSVQEVILDTDARNKEYWILMQEIKKKYLLSSSLLIITIL